MAKSPKKKNTKAKVKAKPVAKVTKLKPKLKAKSALKAKAPEKKHAASKAKPEKHLKLVKAASTAPGKERRTANLSTMFTPLDDRILVKRTVASDRTAGGIYIPDSVQAEDRPTQGRVVAVGRGHRDEKGRLRPLDVQLGDTVMFNSYGGSEVRIGSEELLCFREDEIIAVVKD